MAAHGSAARQPLAAKNTSKADHKPSKIGPAPVADHG